MGGVRPGAEQLAAFRALLAAHAGLRAQLEEELEAERDMPLGWYEVLLLLHRAPSNRLRMQDLARQAFFSKSGLSQLVTRMVDAGLVTRERCRSDGRGVLATLTPRGRRAYLHASAVHLRGIQLHFGRHLSDADARSLRRLLGRVSNSWE